MRKLIRTDGTEQELSAPVSMADIKKLIGAENVDIVSLRHLGYPLEVLVCNDRQYETRVEHLGNVTHIVPTKALLPVNEKATALYLANCIPGVTHKILGDCVVVPDEDF